MRLDPEQMLRQIEESYGPLPEACLGAYIFKPGLEASVSTSAPVRGTGARLPPDRWLA